MAYLRVNGPELWKLLEQCGLEDDYLEVIVGLYEGTKYTVRGKERTLESLVLERGPRKRCSLSPILFNIFHQAVMSLAESERVREVGKRGEVAGVGYKWVLCLVRGYGRR